jgi:uncharacterized protein (DUF4415 family)
MSETDKKLNSVKRLKISEETKRLYEQRDKSLDNLDPENPVMSPLFWDGATIGRNFRLAKTQISVRIEDEILDWLKADGPGYLTKINNILRDRMLTEKEKASKR